MPFDLVGFSEAAPGTGVVAIAAPTDQVYLTTGDDLTVKTRAALLLALFYAAETTPGYAEVRQPSIKVPYNFIRALDLNDADPTGGFNDFRARPLPLTAREKLNVYSSNATDEDTIIGLMLGDGSIGTPSIESVRPTHSLRGYADQTLTANVWTTVTPTWQNTLEAGTYAIVGMKYGAYISSGFMAGLARLILTESTFRPGVPITQLAGDKITFDAICNHPLEKLPRMTDIVIDHDYLPVF